MQPPQRLLQGLGAPAASDPFQQSDPAAAAQGWGVQAQVHVTMTYTPVASDPGWGNGLGTGPDMGALPQTYFPMRHGCRMHLYNDAYQVRVCWAYDNLLMSIWLGLDQCEFCLNSPAAQ